MRDSNILASAFLKLDKNHAEEVRKGVNKEIIFYLDLFRVWDKWPDEFMVGKKIIQTLKCDPVKNENLATSTVGNRKYTKRFSTCDEMLDWALTLKDIEVARTIGLESGEYYVKATVESRIRELPPFINLLLFFVEETEFELEEESPSFPLNVQ